jgi:hypothetical protein
MTTPFVVVSGTAYGGLRREWALSATDALRLVFEHMKLRRPGVLAEDRRGNPISYFELKALAEDESRESDSRS